MNIKHRRSGLKSILVLLPCIIIGCNEPTASPPGEPTQSAVASNTTPNKPKDNRSLLPLADVKPVPPAPTSPSEPIPDLSDAGQRRLARAREYYQNKRYTEAAIELDKALRREPNHPLLHRQSALAYHAIGNRERVRTHVSKAAAANPDDVVVQYLLGRLAFEDQDRTEAIKRFRIAIQASNVNAAPDFVALSWFNLARTLNAEEYLTAAIEAYRGYESAADLPDSNDHDHAFASLKRLNGGNAGEPISVLCAKLGRIAEAADALKSSFAHRTPDDAARERLARLLAQDKRYEDAIAEAKKIRDEPSRAVDLLATVHAAAGHPEKAIADVRTIYEANRDDVRLIVAYADMLERFNRVDDAQSILDDAAKRNLGDNNVIQWRRADLATASGEWTKLLNILATVMRSDDLAYDTCVARLAPLADNDQAIQTLFAIEDDALDHASAYLLGRLASQTGDADNTERFFSLAVERNPAFVQAREELAQIALDRFDWQTVITITNPEQSDQSATPVASGRLKSQLAQAYAALDKTEPAEKAFAESVTINRTDVRLRLAFANFLRSTDQNNRALRQFEQIVQLNSLEQQAREALVDMYLAKDRRDDAVKQLADLKRMSAAPHRIARVAAKIDLDTGGGQLDFERFQESLRNAIDRHGFNPVTAEHLAESYYIEDKPAAAIETLKAASSQPPVRTETLELLYECHRALIEYDHAAKLLETLLQRHPNRVQWTEAMIQLLFNQQRYDEAHQLVLNQLEREDLPDDRDGLYRGWLRVILNVSKRYPELIDHLLQQLKETPDDNPLNAFLAIAYIDNEQHDKAIDHARQWYEGDRNNDTAAESLTNALESADRFDEAAQFLLDRLRNDPANENLQGRLVNTLADAKRFDDALELIDNAYIDIATPVRLMMKANVYTLARRHDEAIDTTTEAIRAAVGEGQVRESYIHRLRLQLSAYLQFAGRYEDAATKLQKWHDETEDGMQKFDCLTRLAGIAQIRGQVRQGLDALEQAYELAQTLRYRSLERFEQRAVLGVNNDYGYSLVDAGLKIDEAERMIRIALSESPTNGAYLDSYGWLFYKKGEFETAVKWLKLSAGTLQGDDPVVLDHLGDAHWQLGQSEDAVDAWTQAVENATARLEEDPGRPDLTTLLETTQSKLNAAKAGETPAVAPLAQANVE